MIHWAEAMRLAAARFGIAPDAFWRLSVREWRALVGDRSGGGALGRAGLERLMAAWPDHGAGFETRASPAPQPDETQSASD
jgi:uncharacterized phage protein (TIGR02216 family)